VGLGQKAKIVALILAVNLRNDFAVIVRAINAGV
jgi:hypothetical protein